MSETIIQLPDDSGNTGKKVRTNDRVVGANTVYEHFTILQDITNDTQARILASTPASSDAGVIVRPIQDGIGSVLITNGGSVAITNTPSANVFVVSGNNWTGIGSVFGAGGFVNTSGVILNVVGMAGSVNVMNTGSVIVTNTVNTTPLGSVAVTNTPSVNSFVVSGNAWVGIGSVIPAGGFTSTSGVITNTLTNNAFIVSGNNWTGTGSTFGVGGFINVSGVILNTVTTNIGSQTPIPITNHTTTTGYDFSGATIVVSGTNANVLTPPNTGSAYQLLGYTLSTEVAMLARILFRSGTTITVVDQYMLPASGTVVVNNINMMMSGAANRAVALGTGAAGSVYFTPRVALITP